MAKIITMHAFRNGVGRSTLIVNLAALLAGNGRRVGVLETNFQTPGLHILFHIDDRAIKTSFTTYLCGECNIDQTIYNITPLMGTHGPGALFFIPANSPPPGLTLTFPFHQEMERFHDALQELVAELELDLLLIDPSAGLTEEALYCLHLSDTIILALRPDCQDYQGTGLLVNLLRKLSDIQIMLLVNDVPAALDFGEIRTIMQARYRYPVMAVVPHSDAMLRLGSKQLFVSQYPHSPLTELYGQLAVKLTL